MAVPRVPAVCIAVLLAAAGAFADSKDCPLSYRDTGAAQGGLLMGGVLNTGECTTRAGGPCRPREGER
jgi:hypothetical protein